MTRQSALIFATGLALGASVATGWRNSLAQGPGNEPAKHLAVSRERFEFEIIEGYDAKYLGDTPGFLGRQGALEGLRPRVALGDPVFREKDVIGHVTGIEWDRSKNALSIEFDPEPLKKIAVGEIAWIALDGSAAPKREH